MSSSSSSLSSSLSDGGSISIGLLLVVVAGFLNGSWNVSFRPTHGYAVARRRGSTLPPAAPSNENANENNNLKEAEEDTTTTNPHDLEYHQAWILFQVYAVLLNIPICLYWAGGPSQVATLIQASDGGDIFLVALFSLLWGAGSVGFGMACQVAGVGLGTNLCMGVIMVLGTFLPLCLEGAIGTPAGALVVTGLVICCLGLALAVTSLQVRDQEERGLSSSSSSSLQGQRSSQVTTSTATMCGEVPLSPIPGSTITATDVVPERTQAPSKDLQVASEKQDNNSSKNDNNYSTLYKVAVCVVAGIFAAQLQFAFVFGQDMIDLAKADSDNVPSSGTSAVVWLFAFTLGAPASIAYGVYNNPPEIPWSRLYRCPWYRHVLVLLTTSLPWITHIHLYGFSTTLLPDDLAASVAWPILMMMTVVTGILWSIVLGEWTHASQRSKTKLYQGLAAVTTGVIVIMASVSL